MRFVALSARGCRSVPQALAVQRLLCLQSRLLGLSAVVPLQFCECLGANACVAAMQRYRSADSRRFLQLLLQLQLLAFGKTLASQALEPLPPSCKRAKGGAR